MFSFFLLTSDIFSCKYFCSILVILVIFSSFFSSSAMYWEQACLYFTTRALVIWKLCGFASIAIKSSYTHLHTFRDNYYIVFVDIKTLFHISLTLRQNKTRIHTVQTFLNLPFLCRYWPRNTSRSFWWLNIANWSICSLTTADMNSTFSDFAASTVLLPMLPDW